MSIVTNTLQVVVLKPSKYRVDGYVERFQREFMPNSTVPYVRSMTPATTGDTPIEVYSVDEYVHTDLKYMSLLQRKAGMRTLLALVSDGVHLFWGHVLHGDRVGDFVAKPMSDCNGEEIPRELCGHFNFDQGVVFTNANCIPCRMPYITSIFMPRAKSDRPMPVPKNSKNLAFINQFVDIDDDVVFAVEYSVRVAQMVVYQLLEIDREIPAISRQDKLTKVKFDAVLKAFA